MKRTRNYHSKRAESSVHFVIVDLDKSNLYPLNFVCVLPLWRKFPLWESAYSKIFGEKGISFALKSLSEALKTAEDEEIIKAIRTRLKLLDHLTTQKMNCSLSKSLK